MAPKESSQSSSRSTSGSTTSSSTKQNGRKVIPESIPSFCRGHLPKTEDVERFRFLTRPHVESFNYFLDTGLACGIKNIEPAELDIFDSKKLREQGLASIDWDEVTTVKFWVEDVKVNKPIKPASAGKNPKLLPRECRERSSTYAGQIFGKFCYQTIQRRNGVAMEGTPVKVAKTFGNIPIMVGSKACHLEGLTPHDLVKFKEEVGTD
jgi:DNA-directed RNA polymerase I subunit RPA2